MLNLITIAYFLIKPSQTFLLINNAYNVLPGTNISLYESLMDRMKEKFNTFEINPS